MYVFWLFIFYITTHIATYWGVYKQCNELIEQFPTIITFKLAEAHLRIHFHHFRKKRDENNEIVLKKKKDMLSQSDLML